MKTGDRRIIIPDFMILIKSMSIINEKTATDLLAKLEMAERISHKPAALSAGEKQRTALARAMINNPSLILADEPTGNLDPENAEIVMSVLEEYKEQGGTVILVTHGDQAKRYATKMVRMQKGLLSEESV